MSQSQVSLHLDPLTRLEEAFKSSDADNDDLLNKQEFTKFVELAYRKQCPSGMYESVCERFKSDPQLGVNWNTAKTIYLQANKNHLQSSRKSNCKSASASKSSSNLIKKKTSISNSSDSNSTIIRSNSISISSDNGNTYTLNNNKLNQYKLHRRTSTLSSQELHSTDTQNMIVDILDNKNKSLQNKLLKEKTLRKKTEEIAQSLLNQTDEYKCEISSLKNEIFDLKKQFNIISNENIKLNTMNNQSQTNIKHLNNEKIELKKELNEAYNLYTKIEKDHNITINKLKLKHKTEIDKLCNEFLQSLGAEPGTDKKDINSVIKTLKLNNKQLLQTVDTLTQSLTRKQQSLIEALQAVDNITKASVQSDIINQGNDIGNGNGRKKGKIKNKLKQWNERRKEYVLQRKYSNSVSSVNRTHSIANSDFIGVSEIKEEEMPLKSVNENEMEFLAISLPNINDKNKRQSIQNLEMANSVLFKQMKKMEKQMNDMKVEKCKYDSVKAKK